MVGCMSVGKDIEFSFVLFLRTYGFCKRCCPTAEYKISGGSLMDWLEREEYLLLGVMCHCKSHLVICGLIFCCSL